MVRDGNWRKVSRISDERGGDAGNLVCCRKVAGKKIRDEERRKN